MTVIVTGVGVATALPVICTGAEWLTSTTLPVSEPGALPATTGPDRPAVWCEWLATVASPPAAMALPDTSTGTTTSALARFAPTGRLSGRPSVLIVRSTVAGLT